MKWGPNMKKCTRVILIALSILLLNNFSSQATDLNKYKSLFTFNFIKYIGWPPGAKHGDFVIGVVKNAQLAESLRSITANKKIGYQSIIVEEYNKPEDVKNCQVLLVSSAGNFNKNYELFAQKLMNKNSLIITETTGAIKKGSMINFVIVDGKLKFEISAANAKKFGLDFSNSLLTMNNAIQK